MESIFTVFHPSDLEVWLVKLHERFMAGINGIENYIFKVKNGLFLISQLIFLNSQGEFIYGGLPIVTQKHCPAMPLLGKGIRFFKPLYYKQPQ